MDDSFTEETQRMQKLLFSNDIIAEPDHLRCSELDKRNSTNYGDNEDDDVMGGVMDDESTIEEMILDVPLRTSSPLNELTTSSLAMERYLQDLGSIISTTSLESNPSNVPPEEQEEDEDCSLSSVSSLSSLSSLFELDSDMCFFNTDESQQQQQQQQQQHQQQELVLPFNLPVVLPLCNLTPEIIELLLLANPFFIIPDFDIEDNDDTEFETWLNLDYQE